MRASNVGRAREAYGGAREIKQNERKLVSRLIKMSDLLNQDLRERSS
jgi:hypothetical protein